MESTYSKFSFFTGKGGVGKTSLACATAVKLADAGKKVLLISTDPASNLSDVLGHTVTDQFSGHKDLSTLITININPETAAEEYRERALNPIKELATASEFQKIKEGLSGACTTEIASFDEFSRFITGEGNPDEFDHIIFDTAPTGHTIRLLELPSAWDSFLEKNPGGASCIGPPTALKSSKDRYKKVINALRDPMQTTIYLVARSDRSSLKEAARTSSELSALGLKNQELIVNGVFEAIDREDKIAVKAQDLAQKQLNAMPESLRSMKLKKFPLLPYNILGLEKLRSVFNKELQNKIVTEQTTSNHLDVEGIGDLHQLVNELEKQGDKGLIMTMGKGGVGKTIVAASVAVMLAKKGHQVLLTTTDPAANVNDFIGQLTELPPSLTVERIDPKVETKIYTDKIFEQKSKGLSESEQALLREDLKSPCNEEVAVFHAFSKAIAKAKRQFVVVDTAPTGHTLLLLDTTGKYHKEILKTTSINPERITTPYMMLQNESFAKILLVALPETTPMREAEDLQNDLKRAGIQPFGWVINQCLSVVKDLKDPLLKKRAANEGSIIKNINEKLAERTFLIPFVPEEKILPLLV